MMPSVYAALWGLLTSALVLVCNLPSPPVAASTTVGAASNKLGDSSAQNQN